MKRIGLLMLALAAACAISGAAASTSLASFCVRASEPNKGNWTNATCTEKTAGQQTNWVKIQSFSNEISPGIWCAEVAEANTGNWTNSQCTTAGTGNFIKAYERPDWYLNGSQLKQGSRQIKLQLKGTAVLKSELAGLGPVTVECNGGLSEGATIDGYGNNQGQGKGRITFTSCTSTVCPVAEPIVTKQTKAHLVTFKGQQTKYAELFEPTEGEVFTTLKFAGVCSLAVNVTGKVAAEIVPKEKEQQEGALIFPETAISSVVHEGQEVTPGLFLGLKEAKFSSYFGARLETNERFGVFGSN
jgi:hypothetical protein